MGKEINSKNKYKLDLKKSIIYIDMEANGYTDDPRLIQLSGIKINDKGEITTFDWYSNPECELSPKIERMLNIKTESLKIYPNNQEIFKKFLTLTDDCQIIYFGDYDEIILKHHLAPEIFEKMDFIDYQNAVLKNYQTTKYSASIDDLCRELQIDINSDKKHNAMYDAFTLRDIIKKFESLNEKEKKLVLGRTLIKIKKINLSKHDIKTDSLLTKKINNNFQLMFIETLKNKKNEEKEWSEANIKLFDQKMNLIKNIVVSKNVDKKGNMNFEFAKDYNLNIGKIMYDNLDNTIVCNIVGNRKISKYVAKNLKKNLEFIYLNEDAFKAWLLLNKCDSKDYISNVFEYIDLIKKNAVGAYDK